MKTNKILGCLCLAGAVATLFGGLSVSYGSPWLIVATTGMATLLVALSWTYFVY